MASIPVTETSNWEVEVFYDGDCPLCRREIDMLRLWDRSKRIRFTDIADPSFDPILFGRTHEELMDQIHGRLPSGEWIIGVEVFRRLYAAVGLRYLVAMTRWPVIAPLLDLAYRFFARYRLRLTGRCSAQTCSLPGTSPRSPSA